MRSTGALWGVAVFAVDMIKRKESTLNGPPDYPKTRDYLFPELVFGNRIGEGAVFHLPRGA